MTEALVIGAGPSGLMAAEVMAKAGLSVTVAEKMPSPARKFLMAGKSGLNLTKSEAMAQFKSAFGANLPKALDRAIADFGPKEVSTWAEGLGQTLFTGSTGRVFPRAMKALPLLRAWLSRLDSMSVGLNTGWNWTGWDADGAALFTTRDGPRTRKWDVAVLALGGASWPRLGSDGAWFDMLSQVTPFRPANVGFAVTWSKHMERRFGKPVKGVELRAGNLRSRGEFVVTSRGVEGGGIYEVSRAVRDGDELTIDLLPNMTAEEARTRLERARPKQSLSERLRKQLKLDPVKIALVQESLSREPGRDLLRHLKAQSLLLIGPFPLEEAISTAGGLRFDALNDSLMFQTRPGLFAAGEMLDWEAPTGGYLLTACLATGALAGRHAVDWIRRDRAP